MRGWGRWAAQSTWLMREKGSSLWSSLGHRLCWVWSVALRMAGQLPHLIPFLSSILPIVFCGLHPIDWAQENDDCGENQSFPIISPELGTEARRGRAGGTRFWGHFAPETINWWHEDADRRYRATSNRALISNRLSSVFACPNWGWDIIQTCWWWNCWLERQISETNQSATRISDRCILASFSDGPTFAGQTSLVKHCWTQHLINFCFDSNFWSDSYAAFNDGFAAIRFRFRVRFERQRFCAAFMKASISSLRRPYAGRC